MPPSRGVPRPDAPSSGSETSSHSTGKSRENPPLFRCRMKDGTLRGRLRACAKARSSAGRASVSKTEGHRFEPCRACQPRIAQRRAAQLRRLCLQRHGKNPLARVMDSTTFVASHRLRHKRSEDQAIFASPKTKRQLDKVHTIILLFSKSTGSAEMTFLCYNEGIS